VFNRPETTRRVFEAIRAARPSRLYISADGPRAGKFGEDEKCEVVRSIASAVDWPCVVNTKFSNENLGCKLAVSSALDWFFECEEEGIILEDDILPDPSFFPYCDALLEKYRDNENVAMISGCNLISNHIDLDTSYFFSRYCHIWGWATWRRSWNLYDVNMNDWPDWSHNGGLKQVSDGSPNFENYWRDVFQKAYLGAVDTWDYQWVFRCWRHGGLSILPTTTLVENIGFGDSATHTTGEMPKYLKDCDVQAVVFPLHHPENTKPTPFIDRIIAKLVYSTGFRGRVARLVKSIPFIGAVLITLKRR
jgi:hypothetical protein